MVEPPRRLRAFLLALLLPPALVLFLTVWVGPLPAIGVIVSSFVLGWMIAAAHS